MAETLRIDQAVYGYRDGHRLLASSVQLPAEAERAILPLTDGPDLQVPLSQDGYISGYPVPLAERFVLSRTWPAPEMSRPGCVWTHALFISFGQLSEVADLSQLPQLFRRPEGPDFSRECYTIPLEVSSVGAAVGKGAEVNLRLVYWLYAGDQPVLAFGGPDQEPDSWERQILQTWSQQWPELRRDFSFCSTLTRREPGGRPFALRVATRTDPVLLRALGSNFQTLEESPPDASSWLATVLDDLNTPGRLRRVLWKYGDEAGAHRSAFVPLVRLYEEIASSPSDPEPGLAATLLAELAAAFPGAEQMQGLKKDLFGPPNQSSDPGRLRWRGDEVTLLSGVLASPHQSTLPLSELALDGRLRALWTDDQTTALKLIESAAKSPQPPINAMVLDVLLPLAMGSPELLAKAAPAAVPFAIERDPAFAANAVVWRSGDGVAARSWRAIDSIPLVGKARKQIVRGMIAVDSPSVIGPASTRWGAALVGDLLEVVGERNPPRLSSRWFEFLRCNSDAVADWFAHTPRQPNQRQLELIAETADPIQIDEAGRPLSLWMQLFTERKGERAQPSARQLAFLYLLALRADDLSDSTLLLRVYPRLLNALPSTSKSGSFDPSCAGAHEDLLAGGAERRDQVTAALAARWVEKGWEPARLIESAQDSDALRPVFQTYLASKRGRKALKKYLDGRTKKQRAVLFDSLEPKLKAKTEKAFN